MRIAIKLIIEPDWLVHQEQKIYHEKAGEEYVSRAPLNVFLTLMVA